MNIQDIISKFLAGTAAAEELQHLEEWRKESQENLKELEAIQQILLVSEDMAAYKEYNVNEAWDRVASRSISDNQKESKVLALYKNAWVAAAICLLLLATTSVIFFNKQKVQTHFTALEQVETYALPDGSKVVLNQNSSAEINKAFATEPTVNVEGKAYFNVEKQAEGKTFKVELNKGHIEVVGTEFTIINLPNQLEIAVKEGHVIYVLDNRRIDLHEGDKISVIDRDVLKTTGQLRNFNSWVFNRLVFKGTSLRAAIDDLEAHFNVEFSILKGITLSSCQISGTYENQSLSSILDEWSTLLNLTYSIEGTQVIISDLQCR
jgi:transmembrane sensor